MWGYGQYLHPELIFGVLAPPSKGDFSIAQMAHVGGLLRHAWEGGVGRACRLLDEGSPVGKMHFSPSVAPIRPPPQPLRFSLST